MQATNPIRIRRLAIILILILLTLSGLPISAATPYPDVPEEAEWEQSVELLTQLGILQGTPSGLFVPDAVVTREQFAKLAVSIANLATEDNMRQGATPFVDVNASRWSSGWIRTAVSNGYLVGYTDGRFRPETEVTLAQALTVGLRLVGIEESSLPGAWPARVMSKAASLGWTKDLALAADDGVTRRGCAVLLERMLETEIAKESGSIPYGQATGLYSSVVILADSSTDSTLKNNTFTTTAGKLTNASGHALATGGEYRVKLDGTRIVTVYGPARYSLTFTVAGLGDGTLHYRTGSGSTPLILTTSMTFYDNRGAISYGDVFSTIQAGCRVTLAYSSETTELAYLHFSIPPEAEGGTFRELLVLDTAQTSEVLPANAILTDKGTFTLAAGLPVPRAGILLGATTNGSFITAIGEQLNRTVEATVLQAVGTRVVQSVMNAEETLSLPLTATWYHDGKEVAVAELSPLLARCSSIVYGLHPDGERVSYAVLYDPRYSEPQFADQQEIHDMTLGSISLRDVLLSRLGDIIGVHEIAYNDVAYEVTDIWGGNRYVELYQGQHIGIIQAFAPNRFAPDSMQVSVYNEATGRYTQETFQFSDEYPVESLNNGKYGIGDSVILLTGRDGKIVKLYP